MIQQGIIICGFGGQGVIFAGELLGRTAVLAGLEAAQSSSYGSEARGSACHAGVLLCDEQISYPKVLEPDVLIAMSQPAYDKFIGVVKPGGAVFYEADLVNPREIDGLSQFGVPATSIAEGLNSRNVANVVMMAAAIKKIDLVNEDQLTKALIKQSPEAYRDVNFKALQAGFKEG